MNALSILPYEPPRDWIRYDAARIQEALVSAKAAIQTLRSTPYQLDWVKTLQDVELKREIAGTSRIEGAEFTERELEQALSESSESLLTRSQRQAAAAKSTYRWISDQPDDLPIEREVIHDIHRKIVTGADDDHCEPGHLRRPDENVTFGQPRHRGIPGGEICERVFKDFTRALGSEYLGHDPILRALAAHYHLAAMHPFLDGNGRTARALEAFLLQRAGLKDVCFIAMSNYYYEEKTSYLQSLAATRAAGHDLTGFFEFALKGIALQAGRVLNEIQRQVQKAIYRNLMIDLFSRLKSPRKRVIAERQMKILNELLSQDKVELTELVARTRVNYQNLKVREKAFLRDLSELVDLGTIDHELDSNGRYQFSVRLSWPTEITETEFFDRLRNLPKAKSHSFLTR
jgi:Fic family protein